jgi:hypothetical protein
MLAQNDNLDQPPSGLLRVHPGDIGEVINPVLGFLIDFLLWVIGAQMAFPTGFRLSHLGDGKSVPSVAGIACAKAAIRVNATHSGVGPGALRQFIR